MWTTVCRPRPLLRAKYIPQELWATHHCMYPPRPIHNNSLNHISLLLNTALTKPPWPLPHLYRPVNLHSNAVRCWLFDRTRCRRVLGKTSQPVPAATSYVLLCGHRCSPTDSTETLASKDRKKWPVHTQMSLQWREENSDGVIEHWPVQPRQTTNRIWTIKEKKKKIKIIWTFLYHSCLCAQTIKLSRHPGCWQAIKEIINSLTINNSSVFVIIT